MSSSKCIVCLCEDVTDVAIAEAVRAGYADIESLKRYTGFATGPCQGKTCLALARRVVAREIGDAGVELGDITHRPPLVPVPLRQFAGDEEDAR